MTKPKTLCPLTPAEEQLWRALARLMVVLPRAIDEDSLARTGLSLTSYITLSQLSEAPDRRLRMSELAERAALSPSRMTRVVCGLEADGFVRRIVSPCDHRSSLACLTAAGLTRLEQAWPAHLESVRALAIDHINRNEVATMRTVIDRIVATIDARH